MLFAGVQRGVCDGCDGQREGVRADPRPQLAAAAEHDAADLLGFLSKGSPAGLVRPPQPHTQRALSCQIPRGRMVRYLF